MFDVIIKLVVTFDSDSSRLDRLQQYCKRPPFRVQILICNPLIMSLSVFACKGATSMGEKRLKYSNKTTSLTLEFTDFPAGIKFPRCWISRPNPPSISKYSKYTTSESLYYQIASLGSSACCCKVVSSYIC